MSAHDGWVPGHDRHCERQNYPGRVVCACASRAYDRNPYTADDLERARQAADRSPK